MASSFRLLNVIFLFQMLNLAVTFSPKKYRLSLFVSIPFTGNEPRDGMGCKAASQVVIDVVNNRSDILTDYEILPDFQNEGVGQLEASALLTHVRSFENNNNNISATSVYQSPIVTGFFFSPSCQATSGSLLTMLNVVAISGGCNSPIFTDNRQKYPNLYRTRNSGEMVVVPRLRFISEIGGWSKIAVLTTTSNINNYALAIEFWKAAIANGLSVPWFNIVVSPDENVVESLKNSDLRIFVVDTGEPGEFYKFLCLAALQGLNGSRYVFIAQSSAFVDPMASTLSLPNGCSAETIVQQLKATFFIGMPSLAVENFGRSNLGYDLAEYETLFDKVSNNYRKADYITRHFCHDAMLQVLLTLNNTETELQNRKRLTLKDYSNNQREVMLIANETAGKVEYMSLRVGRLKYSSRLEMDGQLQTVSYWTSETASLQTVVTIRFQEDGNFRDVNSYYVKRIAPIKWLTLDGKPPNDSPKVVRVVEDVSSSVFAAVTTISVVLSAIQVAFAVKLWMRRATLTTYSNELPFSGIIFTVGCLIANVGSILFSLPALDVVCALRSIAVPLALSLIHSFIFLKLLMVGRLASSLRWHSASSDALRRQISLPPNANNVKLPRASVASMGGENSKHLSVPDLNSSHHPSAEVVIARSSSSLAPDQTQQMLQGIDFCKIDKKIACLMAAFASLVSTVVIVWLSVDRWKFKQIPSQLTGYRAESDVFYDAKINICSSKYQAIWLATLIAANVLPLMLGGWLAFDWRRSHKIKAILPQLPRLTMAIANELTLTICTVAATAASYGSPVVQYIEVSFALLLASATVSVVMFSNSFRHNNNNR